ncbi:hypothetical protein [Nonomuraea sp. B19D2]|uniref:hypothetical protein n=1 Tax=Nonomuraea sp. B19D2 TaxID=3159561 RepID=UPI0032DA0736
MRSTIKPVWRISQKHRYDQLHEHHRRVALDGRAALMTAGQAYAAIAEAGVRLITGTPDSLLNPLHRYSAARRRIPYVPCGDEATAVGLASGARLAGARSLVRMENNLLRGHETAQRLNHGALDQSPIPMTRHGWKMVLRLWVT